MEELEYIRVYKPLPGVKETFSPMEDSAAKLATARCAVRAGLKVLAFGSASNYGWLQTRPALVRACMSRFRHCPRIFPHIGGIRCPLLPRSDVCRAMADGLNGVNYC